MAPVWIARFGFAATSRFLLHWLAALAGSLLLMSPVMAQQRGNHLVTAQWLQKHLGDADVVLLDASLTQMFRKEHIPGAVSVDVFSLGPNELTTPQIEERIRSWGVSAGRKVVVYDNGGTYMATRIFHELYYNGFPAADLFVLDGGLAKWKEIGGAVTKEPTPAPAKGTFRIGKLRDDARVRLPQFLAASGDPANHALVEALEPEYYFGGNKFFDRAGHVPNAILWNTEDFFNADKTFKSPAEITRMLDYLGIRRDQHVHSYCGGGIAATVPWFALKLIADYPKVSVYRESQREWLRDERQLPLWTYGAPFLARDPAWLNGWSGPMTRLYGVSNLSLIDVRSAEAYGLGHIPYALSVPAGLFRTHLDSPDQLAAALGAAGVNPAEEAVIVAEKGVNENSALAFVLMERLGHRKVSILLDSVDDWGLRGYPLTKEPTRVGARKSPQEAVVPPATYRASVRANVMVRDAAGASAQGEGRFPKVFLASGKQPLAKAPEGKVVHVPYTQLLNADGTPKPAKDLWTVLSKAGVPRYAEIVCIADDPGEAAVAYFILRLMGYPDVKVLLTT